MELKKVKIDFPLSINVDDSERTLSSNQCTENINVIKTSSRDIKSHPLFKPVDINDSNEIVKGVILRVVNEVDKLIVYGIDENGGFLSTINLGDKVLGDKIENLQRNIPPDFVRYRDKVFCFNITVPSMENTPVFTHDRGFVDSDVPLAATGCSKDGRLFVTNFNIYSTSQHRGPGYIQYTLVGQEALSESRYFLVGMVDEPIIKLVTLEDRIIIIKEYEVWQLKYDTLASPENARLTPLSENAGAISAESVSVHDDVIFCYNSRGAYLINPRNVSVNTKDLLQVDPGVFKLSDNIDTIFESSVNTIDINPELFWEVLWAPGEWHEGLFDVIDDVSIESNGWYIWHQGESGEATSGKVIFHKLVNPQLNKQFIKLRGQGRIDDYGLGTIKVSVSENGTDWHELPFKEENSYLYWNCNINSVIDVEEDLYIKIDFTVDRTDPPGQLLLPSFEQIKVYNGTYVEGLLFGGGWYDEKFYVLKPTDEDAVSLMFTPYPAKYDNGTTMIYNFTEAFPWSNNEYLIGFGKNDVTNKGCLIVKELPYTDSGTNTIELKTGYLDFDEPNVPKKFRKAFFTYKCNEPIALTIYDENDYVYTRDLPISENFIHKELNFNTNRSKWYQFKIETSDASFVLRDFSAFIKVFKVNE